ncbi:tetratricopeptide repeat protein [Henriciella sp.]|uniref:tetratricopeptide repeat protein n=1 Tax=Henriciella sp. TaxID=1968823 RepID=UPI00260B0626|nr:tetratricopeptide repeat protein [Henriciella sp.]
MARIFISFTSSDRPWAHWIGHELISMGHEVRIHDWEQGGVGGGNFRDWMSVQLRECDYTLCLVSPEYFDSSKTDSADELRTAAHRASSERSDFCRIAMIRPCVIDAMYMSISRCDLVNAFEAQVRARLQAYFSDAPALAVERAINPVPFPGRLPHNLKISAPPRFFHDGLFGRGDILRRIDDSFQQESGHRPVVVLGGIPGSGKTTVAVAYAEMNLERYRLCWWINAADPESIRVGIAQLGVRLGWVQPDETDEFPVREILDRLEDEGRDLLIIYDNAISEQAIREFVPKRGNACILITSNSFNWRFQEYGVDTWNAETGGDFLIRRIPIHDPVPDSERQTAEEISRELEGLPLALEMAGAYCALRGMTPTAYARLFAETFDRVFNSKLTVPVEYHAHRPAATSYEIAITYAQERDPAAAEFVLYLSLLAPDWIPLFIFEESQATMTEPLRSLVAANSTFDATLVLIQCGLLLRESVDDNAAAKPTEVAVRMHRFVRKVVPAQLDDEKRNEILAVLTNALQAVFPIDDSDFEKAYSRARWLMPHAEYILGADLTPVPGAEIAAAELMRRMAPFQAPSQDGLRKAGRLLDRSLELYRDYEPSNSVRIAEILVTKALWEVAQSGDTNAQADQLGEEVLSLLEALPNPGNEKLAMLFVALARVNLEKVSYQSSTSPMGGSELGKAAMYCQRAFELIGNNESLLEAYALNIFGRTLSRMGRLAEARKSLANSLRIRRNLYNKVHPATARSLVDLAEVMLRDGHYSEAYESLRDAREVYSDALGLESHGIVLCDGMEAWLELEQNNVTDARTLLKRSLALSHKVHGPNHKVTKARIDQLAALEAGESRQANA